MRAVIQRVSNASVTIHGEMISAISTGFMVLLGVEIEDTQEDAEWLARKIAQLRVFSDEAGLMNKELKDVDGEIMVVSQFTLHASYKKGNRPSFIKAAKPDLAIPLFEFFKAEMAKSGLKIESGIFGADMKVAISNDGPVTIVMDSITKK